MGRQTPDALAAAEAGDACGRQACALLHALLGNLGPTLSCLEVARSSSGCEYLAQNPAFDSFRGEPRFQRILADMGLGD